MPSLNYAAPRRRVPRTYFIWVLLAPSALAFYCAFTGYCYLVYGHRPVYGGPMREGGWELLAAFGLVLLLASPVGAMLCGVQWRRLGPWPRRVAVGIVLALVVFAANYVLYTVDPYGVTVWMKD